MTEKLFQSLINKLKEQQEITDDANEILNQIRTKKMTPQLIFSDFLQKIIKNNNYNISVMNIIKRFLEEDITLEEISSMLFNDGKKGYRDRDDLDDESLIKHDNLKRGLNAYIYPYNKPQFNHFENNEPILAKMIRVIFEFTRGDEKYLRGVCFDYCLFLCALDIIKNGTTNCIITYGLKNGEINWIIIRDENVLDPYFGSYMSLREYEGYTPIGYISLNDLSITEAKASLTLPYNAARKR